MTIDNIYIVNGLDYPLPERLTSVKYTSKYGKGSIDRKGRQSYHVLYNNIYYLNCRTYEQAYYISQEFQKCSLDKDELPLIMDGYLKWYLAIIFLSVY